MKASSRRAHHYITREVKNVLPAVHELDTLVGCLWLLESHRHDSLWVIPEDYICYTKDSKEGTIIVV